MSFSLIKTDLAHYHILYYKNFNLYLSLTLKTYDIKDTSSAHNKCIMLLLYIMLIVNGVRLYFLSNIGKLLAACDWFNYN